MAFQYTSGDPTHLTGGANASMADIQGPFTDLKTFLNARIAAIPTLVSALPVGPVDGQEIYYQADATNGVVWHLRYRAASASAYKWEYVGGTPMSAFVATSESMSGSTYVDLTTVGPQITVPLAGEYRVRFGADASNNVALNLSLAAPKFGAAATVDADAASVQHAGATGGDTIGRVLERRTVSSAGTVIKLQYRTNANFSQFLRRLLEITPLRVG